MTDCSVNDEMESMHEATHLTKLLSCCCRLPKLREARVHDWVLENVQFRFGHHGKRWQRPGRVSMWLKFVESRKEIVLENRRGAFETRRRLLCHLLTCPR